MSKERKTLVLVVVILLVITFAFYTRKPQDDKTQLVKIGVLTYDRYSNASEVFLAGLAIEDINKYCINNSIPYQFEAVYKCAKARAQLASELTDEFHEENVSIVVGFQFGSMLDCCDTKSKNYEMIIVSPYCTSPVHRDVYRHIFQLMPVTLHQSQVIARSMIELGYTETVIYMENYRYIPDYNYVPEFQEYYEKLGGTIIDTIIYYASTDPKDYNATLSNLGEALRESNAAVFYPDGFDHRIFDNLKNHPFLLNHNWFATCDVNSNHTSSLSVYPELSEIGLIHPYLDDSPDRNELYSEINDLYIQEFGENMTRYTGNVYDAVWLSALTLIEIGDYNNVSFIESFPDVARSYEGVSGNTTCSPLRRPESTSTSSSNVRPVRIARRLAWPFSTTSTSCS